MAVVYLLLGGGGACGGLFFCSSRHNPQGNGLPCLGHLVALIAFHLGGAAAKRPRLVSTLFGFCRMIPAAGAAFILRELVTLCQTKIRLFGPGRTQQQPPAVQSRAEAVLYTGSARFSRFANYMYVIRQSVNLTIPCGECGASRRLGPVKM